VQLNNTSKVVKLSSEVVHSGFGFKDEALIFSLLIDKIYTNKPAAVIRELWCNGYDAGTLTKVSIPSPLEPMLVIRDNGAGMSHDFMMNRFTLLGDSTKNMDNNLIGGFGAGRMSGLAYADSFTVTTFIDGTKRVYTVFMGANKIPQISLGHTSDTDEPNGTEVRIAVKREDFDTFKQEALSIAKWFPPESYEAYGFTPEQPEWLLKTDTWGLLTKASGSYYDYKLSRRVTPDCLVTMGPVAYKIDWSKVGFSLPTSIVAFAPIGSLDLPPSRETLSYDPQTLKNMEAMAATIKQELCTLARETALAMDPWPRAKFIKQLKDAEIGNFINGQHEPFDDMSDHFKLLGPSKLYTTARRYSNKLSRDCSNRIDYQLSQNETTTVVVNDLPDCRRVFARLENHGGSQYLVVEGEFDKIAAIFGKDTPDFLIRLSDLPLPVKTATFISKSAYQMRLLKGRNGQNFYASHQGDVPQPGDLWWPFTGNNPDTPVPTAKVLDGTCVWGLTKTAQAAIDTSQLVLVSDFLKQKGAELSIHTLELADALLKQELYEKHETLIDTLRARTDFGVALWPKLQPVADLFLYKTPVEVSQLKELIALGYASPITATKSPQLSKTLTSVFTKSKLLQLAVNLRQYRIITPDNDALLKELA
jgi:hypothetical protein